MHRDRLLPALLALGVASSAGAGVNLVTNGGFETGDFTGWANTSAQAGSGLSVIAQPHTGAFAANWTQLTLDTIVQNIATSVGEDYVLEFWVWNGGVDKDGLFVEVDDVSVYSSQNPLGVPLEDWTYFSIPFQALGGVTEIVFKAYDAISDVLVDDISVTLVPAPGAAGLLALTGLFASRRRR